MKHSLKQYADKTGFQSELFTSSTYIHVVCIPSNTCSWHTRRPAGFVSLSFSSQNKPYVSLEVFPCRRLTGCTVCFSLLCWTDPRTLTVRSQWSPSLQPSSQHSHPGHRCTATLLQLPAQPPVTTVNTFVTQRPARTQLGAPTKAPIKTGTSMSLCDADALLHCSASPGLIHFHTITCRSLAKLAVTK